MIDSGTNDVRVIGLITNVFMLMIALIGFYRIIIIINILFSKSKTYLLFH